MQSFSRPEIKQSGLAELSLWENSVLELLAKGYLYKEIAGKLGLSVLTIDTFSTGFVTGKASLG